ncbi:OstA-like protein [Ferruginibacter yonginensis]|uniref:OstA-like protein n=1 Tax=Ferruginibacter yonginensis TaxID=1310416 RepID=A0ABV8QNM3_9BACT
MKQLLRGVLLWLFICCSITTIAQTTVPIDSSKRIIIISGNSSRFITLDDSTSLRTLAGNAKVKQGNTILSGDSIVINSRTQIAEVFGNVHINDADTVNTYANYLRYLGKERVAYLKNNVKLTDGKGTLVTNDLEYNLESGIATYKNGGKVINGTSVLTSSDAVYYSDTKDVYFKKAVRLTDPKYNIASDSLMYNTAFKTATLIAPTLIKTSEGKTIKSKNGTYNLQTGEARFYDRTLISDSTSSTIADNMYLDEKTGVYVLEGRAKYVDSTNHSIVIANKIEVNKKENSFLATQKPVVVIAKEKDSTYIAADTLFSGLRKNDSISKKMYTKVDTISNKQIYTKTPQDSIRYVLGYKNVRIYNDSAQAVSDSMYYSTEDSVFRMFKSPVFWKDKSQVSGDTMYLFTENQQPKRLYVFNNSIVINQQNPAIYNQAGGRTLNAYFIKGEIDYTRIKGSPAETIFYPQDNDSAYIGMNLSSGDLVDVYFAKQAVQKIKFVNEVNGVLYPIKQIPADKKYLKNFNWQDARRPKTKLSLFE